MRGCEHDGRGRGRNQGEHSAGSPRRHWGGGGWDREGGGRGRGGRGDGLGGGDFMRFGRMMAQGDLRLVALWLIKEQPRHGYEIIKVLEEKTGGWYAPSPGVVYPTLTYLEEAGYVTAQTDGAKKLYTITDEGRAYLDENPDVVDVILARLSALADKVAQWRQGSSHEHHDGRRERGPRVSRLVDAAVDNLRDIASEKFAGDADAEARIVDILARAASELRKA
jgi:DNA-binding PadR family transcriptional regulator